MFEPSKTFFMFLFVIPANQKCQHCTIAIEKQKSASIIQKAAYKNRQHDFFRLPVLGMFEPSKTFFMFLFVMPVNQNANAAQFRLKSEKSTRINQKTAQKQAARFFRLPVLGMFEPSKTFFHVSFYDASESSANAAQLRLRCQNRQESIRKLHKNRQHDFFRLPAWGCLSRQRLFPCFFL